MARIPSWSMLIFTGAITMSALRISLIGSFRKPRKTTWLPGTPMPSVPVLTRPNSFFSLSWPETRHQDGDPPDVTGSHSGRGR